MKREEVVDVLVSLDFNSLGTQLLQVFLHMALKKATRSREKNEKFAQYDVSPWQVQLKDRFRSHSEWPPSSADTVWNRTSPTSNSSSNGSESFGVISFAQDVLKIPPKIPRAAR